MNKLKLALVAALGLSFSTLALTPVFAADAPADGAQTKVELKGKGESCAKGGKCGPRRGAWNKGGHFKNFLNLTDNQLEQLHTLKTKHYEATGPQRLEIKSLKGQLRDGMSKPTIDKSSLLSLQSKINSLNAELSNNRIAFMIETSSVFTDEQRQKMRRAMLTRELKPGGHHGFRGKRHHRGGGHHFKGGMRSEAENKAAPPVAGDNSVAPEAA